MNSSRDPALEPEMFAPPRRRRRWLAVLAWLLVALAMVGYATAPRPGRPSGPPPGGWEALHAHVVDVDRFLAVLADRANGAAGTPDYDIWLAALSTAQALCLRARRDYNRSAERIDPAAWNSPLPRHIGDAPATDCQPEPSPEASTLEVT